jgi:hypothetical protein
MKRLDPKTNKPFKRGAIRDDGFIFWQYAPRVKKDGHFEEWWCNPSKYNDNKKKARTITKQYQMRMQSTNAGYRSQNRIREKLRSDRLMSSKNGHIALIFNRRKTSAIKNGIPFSISLEYMISIAPDNCPVFNEPLLWAKRTGKARPFSPSIDKIDPNLGYVEGNVQWLSCLANAMKQNATKKQLLKFSKWILMTTEDNDE